MRYFKYVFAAVLFVIFSFNPSLTEAQNFVPCSGTSCSACDFVTLANTVIQWLIGILAVVFAVILVMAGFGLITSGGNAAAKSAAKTKLVNALIGFMIVLAAWLLVDTIMRSLLVGTGGQISGQFWYQVQCGSQSAVGVAVPVVPPTTPPPTCDVNALKTQYNGSDPSTNAPGLQAMISCYTSDPVIAGMLDTSKTFTFENTQPLCAATNGNAAPSCGINSCAHSVNSCHYGRGSGQGAKAVDFNAAGGSLAQEQQLFQAIQARRATCGGRLLSHPDHTHISLSSC